MKISTSHSLLISTPLLQLSQQISASCFAYLDKNKFFAQFAYFMAIFIGLFSAIHDINFFRFAFFISLILNVYMTCTHCASIFLYPIQNKIHIQNRKRTNLLNKQFFYLLEEIFKLDLVADFLWITSSFCCSFSQQ